jgi:hypothetical protein
MVIAMSDGAAAGLESLLLAVADLAGARLALGSIA